MEIRAAWPEKTQMSYNDMKSRIAGELMSEPARVAAHVGATLPVELAGCVTGDEVTPASREPSTLWGEAGRRGVGRAVVDRTAAPMLAPSLSCGTRAGSKEGGRGASRTVGGDILPREGLAAN
jgi:hypothetical protein